MEMIRRIQAGAFPHPEFQAYPDYVDYFTHEKEVMPLEGGDEPKRRFIPSKVRRELVWYPSQLFSTARCVAHGVVRQNLRYVILRVWSSMTWYDM